MKPSPQMSPSGQFHTQSIIKGLTEVASTPVVQLYCQLVTWRELCQCELTSARARCARLHADGRDLDVAGGP